jgi:type IV fimbrial biogenesis protein FimT
MSRRTHGFTMIELMITIVVAAVLIALAAPSYRTYTAKKKVEGTLAELHTDLQFARSEAVSRNTPVRVTVNANCYAVHLPSGASNANCVVTPATASLRTVTVDDTRSVSLAPVGALTFINFDSVRGEASFGGLASTDTEASIDVSSTAGVSSAFNLRARVTKFGRVQVCTTNAMAGYSSC